MVPTVHVQQMVGHHDHGLGSVLAAVHCDCQLLASMQTAGETAAHWESCEHGGGHVKSEMAWLTNECRWFAAVACNSKILYSVAVTVCYKDWLQCANEKSLEVQQLHPRTAKSALQRSVSPTVMHVMFQQIQNTGGTATAASKSPQILPDTSSRTPSTDLSCKTPSTPCQMLQVSKIPLHVHSCRIAAARRDPRQAPAAVEAPGLCTTCRHHPTPWAGRGFLAAFSIQEAKGCVAWG